MRVVAGLGFRGAAPSASIEDALALAEKAAGRRATLLATLDGKADAPALAQLAATRGLPVSAIPPAALPATPTQSPHIRARFDTGSVAEAAALAAAGPGAVLLTRRVISADRMATAALAAILEGDPA